uniref:PPM-type phosphatase domain-containing protein n=1 Tax=Thermosporothrix sp. COM3 TaxID=2490863 RepID=A0A455SF12_9CHLR|nr:hypothetical protein KTC_06620 [Thermosporothrix sp. COM3]
METLKTSFENYRGVRIALCLALLLAGGLLYWIPGGFPPWMWRSLFSMLPHLSALWEQRGPSLLYPLSGLVLLSLSVALFWFLFVLAVGWVVRFWWQLRDERRRFALELQEAEQMARTMAARERAKEAPVHVAQPTRPLQHATVGASRPSFGAATATAVQESAPLLTDIEAKNSDELLDLTLQHPQPIARPKTTAILPTEHIRYVVGMGLDPGLKRKNAPNEDNIFAMQGVRPGGDDSIPVGLFVVADGMGGHVQGQEASRLAIQTISDVVTPSLLHNAGENESFGDIIKDAVHRANLAIYRRNRQQADMMGTTVTTALLVGTMCYIVNVGDSRTYLYRAGKGLKQITRDHSIVARLAENGVIAPEAIYTHPKRNQIYRCLGDTATAEMDFFRVPLQVGDILLLCSDGLWEMVRDDEIERILAATPTEAAHISARLVQAALKNGGADNIGLLVVCVLPAEDQ